MAPEIAKLGPARVQCFYGQRGDGYRLHLARS